VALEGAESELVHAGGEGGVGQLDGGAFQLDDGGAVEDGWPPTRACARCVTRVAAQRKPDKPMAIPGLGWVETAVSVIRSATAIRWRRSEVAIARVHTGGEAVVVGDPGEQGA